MKWSRFGIPLTLGAGLLYQAGCAADGEEAVDGAWQEAMVQSHAGAMLGEGGEMDGVHGMGPPGALPPGAGVAWVGDDVSAFLESQADCSVVATDGDAVTVDLGGLDDGCEYQGRTWAGVVIARTTVEGDATRTELELVGLSDGRVTLDGAETLVEEGGLRTVSSAVEVGMECDGIVAPPFGHGGPPGEGGPPEGGEPPPFGEGPPPEGGPHHPPGPPFGGEGGTMETWLVQTPLVAEEGFDSGRIVDGGRSLTNEMGEWAMEVEAAEIRAGDAVPQAGRYLLRAPVHDGVTLAFTRLDDTRIEVRADGPHGEHVFVVDAATGEPAS
ncbi:hypothetical protein L6R50_24825 [Myxococcota bacterium]|nr:hypothetical protein [Myxococcota bacterium]